MPLRFGGGLRIRLLEALALGVPSVATAVGGSGEILGESGAGRLVPPDDPEALSRVILELLENFGQ